MEKISLKGNVILVDAAYADSKAGGLSAFLHKRLGRDLPKADLAEWLVCCALDSGMQPDDGEVQVVFVYPAGHPCLRHFTPSDLQAEIDGKAFADNHFGEFVLYAVEDLCHEGDIPLMEECIRAVCSDQGIKRLALVCSQCLASSALADSTDKRCGSSCHPTSPSSPLQSQGERDSCLAGLAKMSLLSVENEDLLGVRSQELGFSLLHALGVSHEELV